MRSALTTRKPFRRPQPRTPPLRHTPIENRDLARVFLKADAYDIGVLRVDLHEPCLGPLSFARDQRRARTSEKVRDDVACLTAVDDCALDQFNRLHRRVKAIRGGLVLLPQRALRFVSIPGVLLSGYVAVKNRLMLKLVPAEAPGEGVLRPDDLASNFGAGSFESALKVSLPG